MKALNVLLSFVVSTIVVLVVFEAGLRLIGRGPVKTINVPDAKVGWVKRPDFRFRRKTSEFDVVLQTNELGLRDGAMPSPAKPAGTYRVLCLGDSFVLGYAVPREALFVDLLEHWWRAEGRAIDVVNAGTEGWSTDQEVAWLVEHGRELQPDLVLCFPFENDIWWNGQSEYNGTPKPYFVPGDGGVLDTSHIEFRPESWLSRTAIGHLFRPAKKNAVVEVGGKPVLADFAPLFHVPPRGMEEAEQRTRGCLGLLQQTCSSLGARLALVPIPSHAAMDSRYRTTVFGPGALGGLEESQWSADRPVDFFLTAARELSIPALDVRAPMREAARAGESLYYERDFHLNARGNRAFAAAVKHGLDEIAILPAEVHATTPVPEPPAIEPAPAPAPRWPWVFAALWLVLGIAFGRVYRDEKPLYAFLKVGALLAVIFTIALGGTHLLGLLPARLATGAMVLFVLAILAFVAYKLGARLATISELIGTFMARGHWYLMPLVMILVSIGSLLVVAASSPLVAPFIYTLF